MSFQRRLIFNTPLAVMVAVMIGRTDAPWWAWSAVLAGNLLGYAEGRFHDGR